MNILVTGGAGFIGSHLCEALAKRGGARIISLDDYSTGSMNNHVEGVEYRRGNTRDLEVLVQERLDLIVHLGEFARVEASFENRQRVYDSNVVGTNAVIRRWMTSGKLVYAGSSTRFAVDASDSPYAESKRRNTEEVKELSCLCHVPWAITYFYNVYGPRERSDATGTLIEKFRRQRLEGRPLTVVSPGTQRRNFTHVEDIVEGLLRVIDHGQGEYQIGASDCYYSVLDVAAMFGGPIEMLPPRKGNRASSTLDIRAIEGLGWRQRHRLADYIAEAVSELTQKETA